MPQDRKYGSSLSAINKVYRDRSRSFICCKWLILGHSVVFTSSVFNGDSLPLCLLYFYQVQEYTFQIFQFLPFSLLEKIPLIYWKISPFLVFHSLFYHFRHIFAVIILEKFSFNSDICNEHECTSIDSWL